MHCHDLHYESQRPETERHERSKRKMRSVLIIVSRIGGKLESESGNEHVAHTQQFYSAQKVQILNRLNLLI